MSAFTAGNASTLPSALTIVSRFVPVIPSSKVRPGCTLCSSVASESAIGSSPLLINATWPEPRANHAQKAFARAGSTVDSLPLLLLWRASPVALDGVGAFLHPMSKRQTPRTRQQPVRTPERSMVCEYCAAQRTQRDVGPSVPQTTAPNQLGDGAPIGDCWERSR